MLKKVYIPNTYSNFFLHLKICYLKYDTKYIFCIRSTLNIYFYKIYFLNYNFYIIWNNNSWNIIPYKPQFSLGKNGQEKKNRLHTFHITLKHSSYKRNWKLYNILITNSCLYNIPILPTKQNKTKNYIERAVVAISTFCFHKLKSSWKGTAKTKLGCTCGGMDSV